MQESKSCAFTAWRQPKILKNPLPAPERGLGWVEGFEPSASRATIWRDNQLRHTHHQYFFIRLLPNEPEGIRTPDPRLRRPLLYPTELQTHSSALTAPTRYILSQSYHKCKHFFQIFLIFFKLIFRAFFMPFFNGSLYLHKRRKLHGSEHWSAYR